MDKRKKLTINSWKILSKRSGRQNYNGHGISSYFLGVYESLSQNFRKHQNQNPTLIPKFIVRAKTYVFKLLSPASNGFGLKFLLSLLLLVAGVYA